MSQYFDEKDIFTGPTVEQYGIYDHEKCKKRVKNTVFKY